MEKIRKSEERIKGLKEEKKKGGEMKNYLEIGNSGRKRRTRKNIGCLRRWKKDKSKDE